LLTRLRSDKDGAAAEYELFVFAAMRSRGIATSWSPEIEGQKPDLEANLGARSIVEVFTREEPEVLSRRARRLWELKSAITGGGEGLHLALNEHIPDSIPDHKIPELGARIGAALVTPPVGADFGPTVDLAPFGLKGNVSRLSNPISLINEPAIWGDDRDVVRDRLIEKAKKYKWLKRLRTPYVVIVCRGGARSLVRLDDVQQAMLGREMIAVPVVPGRGAVGEPHTTRKLDGVVGPATPTTGKPRYSRIAAVVYCDRDDSAEQALCQFAVLHNPYAMNPIPPGAFKGFPELTWTIEENMYVGTWSLEPDTWFAV